MYFTLHRVFRNLVKAGDLTIIDAKEREHRYGDGGGGEVVVRFYDKSYYWKIAFHPLLYLGQGYMDEAYIIEKGTLYGFLDILSRNIHQQKPSNLIYGLDCLRFMWRRLMQRNPLRQARKNVAHHYDLKAGLYELFLDDDMQYSCAYYPRPDMGLDQAQRAKKRHIAAKLDIRNGQKILDIGSGWGGLGLYLASLADVSVTGVTLSREQVASARRRCSDMGLDDRVEFRLTDYRQVQGSFDRIVSIGMFEHVGIGNYDSYFAQIHDLLSNDGIALVHSMGRFIGPTVTNPWIARYIFPGGYIPGLSEVIKSVERSGLLVSDIEILRLHYAKTLRAWRKRFMDKREIAERLYDARFCRMWEFYLTGSELALKYPDLMVFQLQLTKRMDALPLTRDYMFDAERALGLREENDNEPKVRIAGL